MSVHSQPCPCGQFFLDQICGRTGLQTERMAAQVDKLTTLPIARQMELRTKAPQWIYTIQFCCTRLIDIHSDSSDSKIGRLGAASVIKGAICRLRRYSPSAIESSM